MSIFSKNIMVYLFVYVASFYTHMTIAMSVTSSTDLALISKEQSSEEGRRTNHLKGVFNIPTREFNVPQDRLNNQYLSTSIKINLNKNNLDNLLSKNRPDNRMVISNSPVQHLRVTIDEVPIFLRCMLNFMQNKNNPNVKMPAINITVEHLSSNIPEQVMNRLDSIEKNLEKAIKKSTLLDQKINELQEKMSALQKDNAEKMGSTEKKYELLSQKLTESKKKYEEELTTYKATQDFFFDKIQTTIIQSKDSLSKSIFAVKRELIMQNLILEKRLEELERKCETGFDLQFKEKLEQLEKNRIRDRYLLYGALATIALLACSNCYLHQQSL